MAEVPEGLQNKWRGLFQKQPLHFLYGDTPVKGADLFTLMDRTQRRYAKFRYIDDILLYGAVDYWASPQELEDLGAGDCEDFAMAKYYYLSENGVSPTRMKLAILYTNNNIWHSVLIVDGKWVLDNGTSRVRSIEYLEGTYKHVYYLSHKHF